MSGPVDTVDNKQMADAYRLVADDKERRGDTHAAEDMRFHAEGLDPSPWQTYLHLIHSSHRGDRVRTFAPIEVTADAVEEWKRAWPTGQRISSDFERVLIVIADAFREVTG